MTDTNGDVALGPRNPRFPSSKFCAPRAAPHLVHRSRLIGELDRGQGARLTLVVGSAGAGKTALLADWAATAPQRTMAWLSCDDADADPVRFVAAMIEALRRSPGQPYIGEDARELLSLDGEVSADVIAALTDDLQRLGGPEVLVIDDFHLPARPVWKPWPCWWSTGPLHCSWWWPAASTPSFGSTGCGSTRSWSSCGRRTCPSRPRKLARSSPGSA